MDFLKYVWRPINGLVIFDCPIETTYNIDGRTEIHNIKLPGLPLAKNFTYRWTLDNPGIDQFCNVTVSHTPTGRRVALTSTVEAAQILVDSLLMEADKNIDWDSNDVKQFQADGGKYIPNDFKDYAFWMSDTTEPVSYKDWEKSKG